MVDTYGHYVTFPGILNSGEHRIKMTMSVIFSGSIA